MNKAFSRRAVLRAGGLTAGALTLGVGMPSWAADRVDAFVSEYQGKYVDYDGYPSGTVGPDGVRDHQLGMMAGTSPSITTLSDGSWVAAMQANTGSLLTAGTAGAKDWRQGMKPGTSPSLSAQANGGYQISFQANTGSLLSIGSLGNKDMLLGMMAGTSPSFGR